MSAALTVPRRRRPRFRMPGIGWLPAVWRRGATWKTVLRFVVLGPLIGGAPYVVFILPIPFAYVIGAVPALVAGWLFATWYHAAVHAGGSAPSPLRRSAIGALSAAAAAAVVGAASAFGTNASPAFSVALIAVHGVPAAVVLALLQRPAKPPGGGAPHSLPARSGEAPGGYPPDGA